MMLGEEGTEQFTVTSRQDGKLIREQRIHDPFVTCTTVVQISRWDLFKAMFKRQFETHIEVCVAGSQGAQRAIMMLDPAVLAQDSKEILEQRRISRETPSVYGEQVDLYDGHGQQGKVGI